LDLDVQHVPVRQHCQAFLVIETVGLAAADQGPLRRCKRRGSVEQRRLPRKIVATGEQVGAVVQHDARRVTDLCHKGRRRDFCPRPEARVVDRAQVGVVRYAEIEFAAVHDDAAGVLLQVVSVAPVAPPLDQVPKVAEYISQVPQQSLPLSYPARHNLGALLLEPRPVSVAPPVAAGTVVGPWQSTNNPFPGVGTPANPLLLTDGTVIVHLIDNSFAGTRNWFQLTPDINGSYVNGTWSTFASLPAGYGPLFHASEVLPDPGLSV
jgi:hypothetical protein